MNPPRYGDCRNGGKAGFEMRTCLIPPRYMLNNSPDGLKGKIKNLSACMRGGFCVYNDYDGHVPYPQSLDIKCGAALARGARTTAGCLQALSILKPMFLQISRCGHRHGNFSPRGEKIMATRKFWQRILASLPLSPAIICVLINLGGD